MKIALLQLNMTVGDLARNINKLLQAVREVSNQGVELCISSELALIGYPPRDLLLYSDVIEETLKHTKELAKQLKGFSPLLLGSIAPNTSGVGRSLYNTALLLQDGAISCSFPKTLLPTYDVFDEDRYFEPARKHNILTIAGKRIAVTICEDIWNDKDFWEQRRYLDDPVDKLCRYSPDLIINLSASPFSLGKHQLRVSMIAELSKKYKVPIAYVNQVGGNDDLVFDGASLVMDNNGRIIKQCVSFDEEISVVDVNSPASAGTKVDHVESDAYHALVLGVRDYVKKCNFSRVLLGLSGGVDSALTLVIAVKALGSANVLGVLMPSPYSSKGSIDDSRTLAERLGVNILTIPIEPIMQSFDAALTDAFSGYPPDVTEENIQARIRGNLLMSLSNKYGAMLLTTGNKSELAVGYCTIYGDMCGGLAAISDVPKTLVYAICRWINKHMDGIIPTTILTKAPSAELRPNQIDQNSLPPYNVLDEILYLHIDRRYSAREIIAAGHDESTVNKVLHLVGISEFKRRQAAPGIRITDRAFGTGWHMPLACSRSW